MHMRTTQPIAQRNARAGFTLVELMVVIFIILVLISISIGALTKGLEWARSSTTEQTMVKLYTAMNKKVLGISREADNWDPPVQILYLAGQNQRRARVIQRKFLTKWSFPQTYREAAYNCMESTSTISPHGFAPTGYPFAYQLYRQLQNQAPSVLPPLETLTIATLPPDPATPAEETAQNAACLAAIFNSISTTDHLSGAEIGDTNGDGIREVLDAWGTGMRFYRWPTGAWARVRTFAAQIQTSDLDDPENLLYDPTWQSSTWGMLNYSAPVGTPGPPQTMNPAEEIEARFHPIRRGGIPDSRFAPLTLASAGPLRQFGILALPNTTPPASYAGAGNPIYERMSLDPATALEELDNLYSFRYRLGVRSQ